MSHIHELIDFTVNAYIVYDNKVLLVHHKKLQAWMPIGGHVELNEDTDEALMREIKEECGLEVEIIGSKPNLVEQGVRPLFSPTFMDIHAIDESHRHIGLVYFARAKSDVATLASKEHSDIRWFTREELSEERFAIRPFIRLYAEEALKQAGETKESSSH